MLRERERERETISNEVYSLDTLTPCFGSDTNASFSRLKALYPSPVYQSSLEI